MKPIIIRAILVGTAAAMAAFSQIPTPAGKTTGPGVIAASDAREPEVLKTCKVPPPTPAGGRGPGRGPAPAPTPLPREYTVSAIPGVIAAGQQWKEVWQVDFNNADGLVPTKDGGLLIPENDLSIVVKLDKDGKVSTAYSGTNTGGSLAVNSKGALFVANRGLNASIEQLAPQRKTLANKYNDDPLDCVSGFLNDITADSKGGVYVTMAGTVFYADSKGKVTRFGENLRTNGIVLSGDDKRLFVTNGPALVAFDVQKDGSLTNQREFAKLEGGGNGDGSAFDMAGRLYVSSNPGVQVIGPDGKYLGIIPTPRPPYGVTFSGPDRKTLYIIGGSAAQGKNWVMGIQTIAQGPKGRAK